jgi:hypothetical protein
MRIITMRYDELGRVWGGFGGDEGVANLDLGMRCEVFEIPRGIRMVWRMDFARWCARCVYES